MIEKERKYIFKGNLEDFKHLPKVFPSFFGEDVTNNSYYKNKNLSKLA